MGSATAGTRVVPDHVLERSFPGERCAHDGRKTSRSGSHRRRRGDDPDGATALVEYLGCEYFEASNADDAIRLPERHPQITIVFTDIQTAGSMDGLELAAYVRKPWPPVKIIIVSSNQVEVAGAMPKDAVLFRKHYAAAAIGEAIEAYAR